MLDITGVNKPEKPPLKISDLSGKLLKMAAAESGAEREVV